MSPELFNLVAAAARARCRLAGVTLQPGDLEPPHPAFTGFRRVTYLWEDGPTTFPIGDRVRLWLDFLAERQSQDTYLLIEGDTARLRLADPAGASVWTAGDLEGAPLIRGTASTETIGTEDGRGVDGAGVALRLAAERAAAVTASAVERDSLRRAVAILESPGDGGEVSDVAWPYFVLPGVAYSAEARRLLAAAAAAWPLPEASVAVSVAVQRGLIDR